jgi:hypothetical protein
MICLQKCCITYEANGTDSKRFGHIGSGYRYVYNNVSNLQPKPNDIGKVLHPV